MRRLFGNSGKDRLDQGMEYQVSCAFHISEGSGYSEQDAMLVLKDILAHEYMDNKRVDELAKGEKLWRKF